jgi:hypothetical protein
MVKWEASTIAKLGGQSLHGETSSFLAKKVHRKAAAIARHLYYLRSH